MSIKKHIPNTITCCNLISGCIATSFAFGGNPEKALLWIIIGAIFDFFDGMSARLLHVSSPIGKELRLAKFNLDERQTTSFIGVPTPANALFWGSLVVSSPSWITNQSWSIYLVLALIFITSFLLVCELPLFALKFKQWSFKGNEVKYSFVGFAIAVLAVSVAAEGARGFLEGWWPIILMYVLLSWMMFLKKK